MELPTNPAQSAIFREKLKEAKDKGLKALTAFADQVIKAGNKAIGPKDKGE
jgi:hypothetical protein